MNKNCALKLVNEIIHKAYIHTVACVITYSVIAFAIWYRKIRLLVGYVSVGTHSE